MLISDKDIQSILLKLDKNKPREREFRQYLDDNVNYGIDRKETVLRMWEFISNKNSIIHTSMNPVVEVKKEYADELSNRVDERN